MNRDIVVEQVQSALALLGVSVLSMMRRDKTQTESVGRGTSRNPKNEGLSHFQSSGDSLPSSKLSTNRRPKWCRVSTAKRVTEAKKDQE